MRSPPNLTLWGLGLIALIVALALTACTHADTPPPAIDVRIQRVEIPVPAPCLAKDKIPAEPEHIADKLTGDARRDLDLVAANALRLRAWGDKMRAALLACSGS